MSERGPASSRSSTRSGDGSVTCTTRSGLRADNASRRNVGGGCSQRATAARTSPSKSAPESGISSKVAIAAWNAPSSTTWRLSLMLTPAGCVGRVGSSSSAPPAGSHARRRPWRRSKRRGAAAVPACAAVGSARGTPGADGGVSAALGRGAAVGRVAGIGRGGDEGPEQPATQRQIVAVRSERVRTGRRLTDDVIPAHGCARRRRLPRPRGRATTGTGLRW